MSNDEARKIVQSGLDRRKEDRQIAEREGRLERYEQDMIDTCNKNCANAKVLRLTEESGRLQKQQMEAKRLARAEALAKEMEREEKACSAVKKYIVACMALLCLTIFTYLPMWAAVTFALGLAVFPAAYVFRLYYPLED